MLNFSVVKKNRKIECKVECIYWSGFISVLFCVRNYNNWGLMKNEILKIALENYELFS